MKFDLVSRGRCCIELLCAQPGLLLFLKRTKSTTAPRVTRYGTERGCHEKEKGGCFSYFFFDDCVPKIAHSVEFPRKGEYENGTFSVKQSEVSRSVPWHMAKRR